MTKQLEKRFMQVGSQSDSTNPLVITKFFNPCGAATWYVTEYDPETQICFGYVTGLGHDEWGSFSLSELQSIKTKPLGIGIERDKWFDEIHFDDLGLPF